MTSVVLITDRLILRSWRDADLPLVADITADPEVMRFFHLTRSRAQSDAWVERTQAHLDRNGFGIFAVEAPGVAPLIGFAGLSTVPASLPCAPAIEAVWTFGAPWWRQGYCTEAARAVLADGFGRLGLAEIVAFTAEANLPSQSVMSKLGMSRDFSGDFGHPQVPMEHPMHRHVLFRLPRPDGGLA
jgi:RimJ/RimL family protein N-acetyltransferase